MKLYEIDAAIEALVDPETGEVADYETFMALQMAREAKCENIALLYKNTLADAAALKAEEAALAARRKTAENAAARLKDYLDQALGGTKLETSKVKVSYRRSTALELDEEFLKWAEAEAPQLIKTTTEPNKADIKSRISGGESIPHARLVERENIQIK